MLDKLIRLTTSSRIDWPLSWMPRSQPASIAPVRLPFDELPHGRSIEWWHFMGRVAPIGQDDSKLTFVLSVLKARVVGLSNLVGLLILIDHDRRTYTVHADLSPMAACYADPGDGRRFRFQFASPDASSTGPRPTWEVAGGMGCYTIGIRASQQLSLRLLQETPAVLLGKDDHGVMRYVSGDEMAYYAWSNMSVSGSRGAGGKRERLVGRAWMEHQWGDMTLGEYRWKYMAIDVVFEGQGGQSDPGGGQLLFFRAEKSADEVVCAVWVTRSGRYSTLARKRIKVTPGLGELWNACPIGTTIVVEPSAEPTVVEGEITSAEFHVTPLFRAQECASGLSTAFFPKFWEGACTVRGDVVIKREKTETSHKVSESKSWAITELAGYAQ
jgi:predicted secreted hydrolase